MDWDLLSSYMGLLTLAVSSIYAGSFASLPPPKSQSTSGREEKEEITDRVSAEDAWLFPVFGSIALYGLYAIIKYFGSEWINFVLRGYFAFTGVGSVWLALHSFVKWVVGANRWQSFDEYSIWLAKGSTMLVTVSWRSPTVYLIPVAILPSFLYTISAAPKSALLTDILALSFSYNALSMMKLDSFVTGCIVLSGLFFYDIWWVFGTDVMLSVATKVDAPIKLLWPKSIVFSTARGFTMLGLGDIVVPGIFVALALRYDHYQATKSGKSPLRFPKPYFWAALFAYFLGLSTTVMVMHVFEAAQPALLYLSPSCMLSFFVTAFFRGEFKEAWGWADGLTEDMNANMTTDILERDSHVKKTQ